MPTKAKAKAPPLGGATYFDDLTWGMSAEEIGRRYKVKLKSAKLAVRRHSINGVPVQTSFHFAHGELSSIAVSVLRTYAEWGDGDSDVMDIVSWISERAGPRTEKGSASSKWLLPTAKIWTYCDESLGAYFDPPPK